ncbi:hypothetical protein ACFLZB_00475 [Nanoarchaeota archaeon]
MEKFDLGKMYFDAAVLQMEEYKDNPLKNNSTQLTIIEENLNFAKTHGTDITQAYQRLERLQLEEQKNVNPTLNC